MSDFSVWNYTTIVKHNHTKTAKDQQQTLASIFRTLLVILGYLSCYLSDNEFSGFTITVEQK